MFVLVNFSMEESPSPSASMWIPGIVTLIDKEKQFGFIQPQTELPDSFSKNRDVHFHFYNITWNIQEHDYVEFQLHQRRLSKPSAFAIRPVESAGSKPHGTMPQTLSALRCKKQPADGSNKSIYMPVSSASTSKNSSSVISRNTKDKRRFSLETKERHIGKVAKVQDTYGFIRHDTIQPKLEANGADLYFSNTSSVTGHFKLDRDDQVSFYVCESPQQKVKARDVRLVQCSARPVEIIEDYIKSLLEKIADDDGASREHMIVAVTCLPVWECIGQISNVTDNGLKMLLQLLIQLNEKEFLKESGATVLETLHKTPLFAPNDGRLCRYMNNLMTAGVNDELSELHRLIVLMAERVPKCGRHITEFLKPVISSEKGSCEKLLYQLLRQFTKGSAGAIENMQWNELPLVPSVDELVSGKLESYSSLQRVIEKGEYPSSDVYIDTYFRLLRVDCFSALAKGVTDLLSGRLDSRDMNVYRGIHLAGVQLSHSGSYSGMSIGLAVASDQKINWDQSSRLMFGNLLCISISGTFQDPIWATVINRDLLTEHQIVVIELCCESNSSSNSESLLALYFAGPSSVMVESPSYYRAYEPVLRALQNTDTEQIAFKDELVSCQQGTHPTYIMADTEFDAGIIQVQTMSQKLNALCYSFEESSLALTSLDVSQEAAIKECLRNRLAIIQGPPGTGKTFVGVKIVELLLSASTPLHLPILILTYKNHSLDEFLKEMIKRFPHSVARVGGRSQEKELSTCTLNVLKRSQEFRVSEPIFKEIMRFKAELNRLKQEIDEAFDKMEEQRYFSVDSLLQFFDHEQMAQFLRKCAWSKTKQKPFKSKDDSKFQTVSKTITCQEVSELVQSCGMSSSVKTEVEARAYDKDGLGAKLYQLLKSALSLWLPKGKDFQEFDQYLAMTQGSLIGKYKQIAKTETSVNGDWLSAERDTEETVQERLAASLAKQLSAKQLFQNFRMFGSFQEGHLLKAAQVAVETSAAGSLTGVHNLWDLNTNDRILLIQYVQRQKLAEAGKYLQGLLTEYEKVYRTKQELEEQQKVNILQRMKIVGMTVTGANICRSLVAQMKPAVILVEEAAEVLEPQLVALMGNWVKHLIMIGDHKQLRPSVENYILARDYHLDLSMMERLINNGLSYATLTMQNRMRPEFADLLLDIYPGLQSNLARVESNKRANCIGQSMYFWNHREPETSERSFTNKAEAERAVRLALFLIDQGYQPSQITILSPYLGQVRLIRQMVKAAEKEFKDLFVTKEIQPENSAEGDVPAVPDNLVRVHTVDLYQGDENDFVIISLVRSNDRGNVGFLNVLNRRCVAQSRAQCGLYFIGNAETLSHNKDWKVLIEGLRKSCCVGTSMPLHCPFHPTQTHLSVSSHEQIPVKQRFCSTLCGHCMPCQLHVCKTTCQPRHSHDICHELVRFVFRECGHSRHRECHEDENKCKCMEEVVFDFKDCSHLGYKKCYQKNEDVKCSEKCTKLLSCNHPCEMKCSEPCNHKTCSVCQKIIEAEAEKQRQAEEKQREIIREAARERIEEIKKQNPEEGVHRQELQPDGDHAEEYFSIEDKVMKYIQPGHDWFPHVTRVEKLVNLKLEIAWLEAKTKVFDPTRCDFKFHGTTSEAVESIIQTGFKLPTSRRQMFGPGIYFASDSSKSAQERYTKGSNMLLVCEVLLGKTKTVDQHRRNMTYSKLRAEGYDSLFAKRDTKETGGVLNDEFVVFNPKQAIPRYIVHYDEMDCTTLSNVGHGNVLMPVSQTLVTHNILPPGRARSFDELEMHFSLVQSHFSLMMTKRNMSYQVQSVDYYLNPVLIRKFEEMQAEMSKKYPSGNESKQILAFHGTKLENIPNIVQANFDLSKLASNTGDRGFYGAGIYFSEFPEVSLGYGNTGRLLLCRVLPGKSYDCKSMMLGQSLQTGFDSHRFGPDAEGRGNELVIFDADQILPCYVINYK